MRNMYFAAFALTSTRNAYQAITRVLAIHVPLHQQLTMRMFTHNAPAPVSLKIPLEPASLLHLRLHTRIASTAPLTGRVWACTLTRLTIFRKRTSACARPTHSPTPEMHLRCRGTASKGLWRCWEVLYNRTTWPNT